MGTCVSRCFPCSSSPPSTAGEDSLSSCGGGSPSLSRHQSAKHAVAVHPLPLASNSHAPTIASTSTSSSFLSAASSSVSMATSTSSRTSTRSSSSSSSSRPFSAEFLKVSTCRDMDMEVVVLDPHKKLPRPASAAPRQSSSPRTPPSRSVLKSPGKKKPRPSTISNSNGRRSLTITPTVAAARRVRPLPPRAPPSGAGARSGARCSASCRKNRPSSSSSPCRPVDSGGRRKGAGATVAAAGIGVGGGEFVDDLISMDCFIFL